MAVAEKQPMVAPRLMGARDAAFYIGISITYLRNIAESGTGPAPRQLGSRLLWDRLDLDDFAETLPYKGEQDRSREAQECDEAFDCGT